MLASGAIEAGPWFVLADELLASGEALVRNLLAGSNRARARWRGAARALLSRLVRPPGRSSDARRRFRLPADHSLARLRRSHMARRGCLSVAAPSGARVLFVICPGRLRVRRKPSGGDARPTMGGVTSEARPACPESALLVLNGADHHARQAGLAAAIDALARAPPRPRARQHARRVRGGVRRACEKRSRPSPDRGGAAILAGVHVDGSRHVVIPHVPEATKRPRGTPAHS